MWIRIETVAEDYCFDITQLLEYVTSRAVQEKFKIVNGEINDRFMEQFIREATTYGVTRSLALYAKKFDNKK
jgi:hypothetical protein